MTNFSILGVQFIEAFLNDVVAIEVLNQIHHLMILESTCAMAVQCDLDHVGGCIMNQLGALIVVGELQQLLAKIVAKWI